MLGLKLLFLGKSDKKVWKQTKKTLSLHPLNETRAILIAKQLLQ